jgi:carboxypeptidase family protein/TonB-dependent receptor-like protein
MGPDRPSKPFTTLFQLLITLGFVAIAGVNNAYAQFETATVLGTVRDQNRAVLQGATVTLKNIATGITSTTLTDANGDFLFTSVKIGNYRVTAELKGFATAVLEQITVTVEARQRVDLTMQVGAATETITITDTAPLLETDSSSKGQVINQRQIVNLPIIGRTYSNLALLVPGVRQSQSGNQGDISVRREGAYNVNGLRSVYNNFLIDGIDNNFYGTTNQGYSNQAVQPSPDSVAEFRMSVNSYSAEYGRTGGAVMNVSTRSGTNQFHGTVWDYLQNTALNATGFFRPPDGRKPQVNRNQFGFVVGGPIIKDRTFFFLDYEGSRWIQSPFQLAATPTLDQRRGILAADVRVPYDFTDSTGALIRAGTLYAAGTPVPMTSFAKTVLNNLPAPNRAGGNNFGGFARNQLFEDKGALKIDHKFTEKLNVFTRYSHRRQTIDQPGLISGFSGGNAIGNLTTYNQQGIAGLTYIISSDSALDYRFAVSRLGMDRLPALVGGPSMNDLFGINGLPEGPRIQGGVTPQDIPGFARIGRQSTNPQAQFPTTVNSRVNYSKLLGRHSLKMGYEYLALNQDVDDTNPLYGLDLYGGSFSRPGGGTAAALADFYFGARSQYQFATQVIAKMRQRFHYLYLQDDFKLNPKLTINAGLRYELVTPVYDANNNLSNFNPESREIVMAKDGSISNRALRNLDTNNFAPRIGLAYQLREKTVLRAGYAIGYNYWNRMASAELLDTNAPFVTRASVQNTAANIGNICAGNNFTGCFRRTQDGYPTNLLTSPGSVILYMPEEFPWSYVQNWHLTVQHQITRNTLIDVGYTGNRGIKLPILADYNQARPLTAAEMLLPANQRPSLLDRRPIQGVTIPGFGLVRAGNITAPLPTGFSNYNALQIKVEHRGRTLQLLNSFTYSKAIDNSSQVLEVSNGGSPNPQNLNNVNNDKGPSSFDQRFNNTSSVVWDVPVGKGRNLKLPPSLDFIIGGWVASSTITLTSGQPLNLRYGDTDGRLSDNQPDFLGGVALRPNVGANGGILSTNEQRKVLGLERYEFYFNAPNITIPSPDQPFGNIGRNAVYGFPFYQVDFGIQKNFPFRFVNESARLEFRAEFFNFFNQTNFSAPSFDRRSAAFGRVSSTFDPRIIQFALKFHF